MKGRPSAETRTDTTPGTPPVRPLGIARGVRGRVAASVLAAMSVVGAANAGRQGPSEELMASGSNEHGTELLVAKPGFQVDTIPDDFRLRQIVEFESPQDRAAAFPNGPAVPWGQFKYYVGGGTPVETSAGGWTPSAYPTSATSGLKIVSAAPLTESTTPVIDTDADGLPDTGDAGLPSEVSIGTNPSDPDSDDDGLPDGDEVNQFGSDPLHWDTDRNGTSDSDDVAASRDPRGTDTDNDRLPDNQEVTETLTNPAMRDTDGDTVGDGQEIADGTDPLNPASVSTAKSPDAVAVVNRTDTAVVPGVREASMATDPIRVGESTTFTFTINRPDSNKVLRIWTSSMPNDTIEISISGSAPFNNVTGGRGFVFPESNSEGPLVITGTVRGLIPGGGGLKMSEFNKGDDVMSAVPLSSKSAGLTVDP